MRSALAPLLALPLANVFVVLGVVPFPTSVVVYGLCSIFLLNFYLRLRRYIFLYITSILLSLQLLSLYLLLQLGFEIVPNLILLYTALLLTALTRDAYRGYVYGVETPVVIILAVVLGIGLGLGSPIRYVMLSLIESLGIVNIGLEEKPSILYYILLFLLLYSTPYMLHRATYTSLSALLFLLKLFIWRTGRERIRYVASADILGKVGLMVVSGGL